MSVEVHIPTSMRRLTRGKRILHLEAHTLRELIDRLEELFPGFRDRLLDERGELKGYINIYRNGRDIREEGGLETGLKQGDSISILPALAGG
ncbi:TPA: MoaD/ThiS family protein [Candidatus Poribacteria bacterium]|nr:MoaD/ThiS family protein [Candidatus Poribacteria bacterium]